MPKRNSKPDWFNIRTYDLAKGFSKKDWFLHFFQRFFLYALLENDHREKTVTRLFESIKSETYPNNIGFVLVYLMAMKSPKSHSYACNNPLFSNNIWSSTREEILACAKYLVDTRKHITDELYVPVDEDIIPEDISGKRHVTVDLNGDKEAIEKEFSNWLSHSLKDYRGDVKHQIINKNHEKLWAKNRVLAYIDLLVWCKLEMKTVKNHGDYTHNQLINWVFQDRHPEGVSSPTITNTKRYVSETMNWKFINRLFKYSYGGKLHLDLKDLILKFAEKENIDLTKLH